MNYETTMHSIWKNLPEDTINKILSYGDPINTQKYKCVLEQIIYYIREFNYHRTNNYRPFCRWYNVSETDYYRYALREVFLKKHVNKYYGDLNMNYHSNEPRFAIVNYQNRTLNVPINNYSDIITRI
tara:strand:+ start:1970 stop:2350 length:381 start_codon:yes stop_codon:yes gene_type:complete